MKKVFVYLSMFFCCFATTCAQLPHGTHANYAAVTVYKDSIAMSHSPNLANEAVGIPEMNSEVFILPESTQVVYKDKKKKKKRKKGKKGKRLKKRKSPCGSRKASRRIHQKSRM